MPLEAILLWAAILTLVSILSIKLSDRFAIPVLLLFLAVGIISGSEGLGGIYFDNAQLAKSIGIVALIFIIFSGGLDTNWQETRPLVVPGLMLSTVAVLLTALIVGFFAVWILKFSLLEGMLLGSIVSSTDAAAVFAVLRSRKISLKSPLKPLLEFESGSNDPMAVFLTVSCIALLTAKQMNPLLLVPRFFLDMGMGAVIGYAFARFSILMLKKLELEYEGLYPVVVGSFILLTYAVAVFVHGNGFLAVYIAGIMIGQAEFPNKKMILKFHDGVAWLMQITMFITLGFLVFPSRIVPFIVPGLLLTLILMLVARPLSIFVSLAPFKISTRKKIMISWVGLRGSVPIILATFPFMAGIPKADVIFNTVFFVVIASVFIQGTSIPGLSRFLKLDLPWSRRRNYPIEFEKTAGMDADLTDIVVPYDSPAVGKKIKDLGVPDKCLIVLISRGGKYIIPYGSTIIEGADVLLTLSGPADYQLFYQTITRSKEK